MKKDSKIYVAGNTGLAGSAIIRFLSNSGYRNILISTTKKHRLDLRKYETVSAYFGLTRPEYVFLCAAKVGGIYANNAYPADFISDNLAIQYNIIKCCHVYNVKKLLFLGSSCIYPKYSQQPIPESALLSGELEGTNKAYAIAKIAGIIMCQSYNKQYGTNFISCMPTNMYGINDNYNPDSSHVIPGMIRRIHEAKTLGHKSVKIWGTGTPRREYLFSDDFAKACLLLMQKYNSTEIINVGSGFEYTIAETAKVICDAIGYTGKIEFDTSKPDGTMRKIVDSSKINALGWSAKTDLKTGIKLAYNDFLKRGQHVKN